MRLDSVFAQCNVMMIRMQPVHIAGIDLNLATVLHALLDERSVSRAGKRIGLSQSATSHALARLRDLLGDPLFVRTSQGLVPTPRAEAMAEPLASALATLEQSFFAPPSFDPATATRRFHVAATDYVAHLLMPPLLSELAMAAPGLDVWTSHSPTDPVGALAQGHVDLVIGVAAPELAGLESVELWDDHFVGVARRGHPITRGKMTLARYVEAQHAFIAPSNRPGGVVDDALAKQGRARRIAFSTQNFLVAPEVVAKTDLIITLASRMATAFAKTLPLTFFELPLTLPDFRIMAFWHVRQQRDPAHVFLRDATRRVAARFAPSRRKRRARSSE